MSTELIHLMSAYLITFAHFFVSPAINAPNSGVVIGVGTTPIASNLDFTSASLVQVMTASASLATMSLLVPVGAQMPYQPAAS